MLQAAIENEVADYLVQNADVRDEAGRKAVVRNGHLPARDLVTGVGPLTVSQVCEEAGIQPTQFYRWQQIFFEHGGAAFERQSKPETSAREQRIAFLESRIQRKDEVLAELMEEHVALKKSLGEP
jgi:transposase-like protein